MEGGTAQGIHRIRPQKGISKDQKGAQSRMRGGPARQPGFAEATENVEGSQGWAVAQSKKS